MKALDKKTTKELEDTIRDQDRKFRVFNAIFSGVVIIGLLVLVLIGWNNTAGIKQQLIKSNQQLAAQKKTLDSQKQILSSIKSSSDERTKQINQINQHLDCIVEFFGQSNRTNKSISDIRKCELRNDISGVVSPLPSPQTKGSTKTTPKPTTKKPTTTPPPKNTQTICDSITLPLLGTLYEWNCREEPLS
jgi:hypothetical protein